MTIEEGEKMPNSRLSSVSSGRRVAEVFEGLATEIADELLQENFIDLNPDIRKLGNVGEDSDYGRRRRAEEG